MRTYAGAFARFVRTRESFARCPRTQESFARCVRTQERSLGAYVHKSTYTRVFCSMHTCADNETYVPRLGTSEAPATSVLVQSPKGLRREESE